MFNNIGGKIKKLAEVICWIGIVVSVVGAIALWCTNTRYQPTILSGFVLLIAGSLVSWIGSFTLYGLGELIERAVSIDEHLAALHRNHMAAPVAVAKPQPKRTVTQPNSKPQSAIKEKPAVQQETVKEMPRQADAHGAEQEQPAMQQDVVAEPPRQIDSHYDEDDMQLLKTFREEGRLTEEEYQNCLTNMKK